jgi:Spy/CpxP family protein refolding chaperone
MKTITKPILIKAGLPALLATGILAATLTAQQAPVDPATHAAHVAAGTMPPNAPAAGDPALSQQLSQLQAKNAQLEAALAKSAPPTVAMPGMPAVAPAAAPAAAPAMGKGMGMKKMKAPAPMASVAPGGAAPTPAMPGMGGGGGMMVMMDKMMGMMDKMMSMEGGKMPMGGEQMAPATPGVMGKGMDMDKMKMGDKGMRMDKMKKGGMGMMAMDKTKMVGMMGMPPMSADAPDAMPQSALPGFPGASHLYHLGATDFFLDHEAHIALTTEQTAALNQAKEKATLAKSTADRVIAQAEQELWTLTASDQPDIAAIEAKTAEIGKLTGEARVAFIRAVGEASKLLTDEQRKILTGFAPPAPAMAPMSDM